MLGTPASSPRLLLFHHPVRSSADLPLSLMPQDLTAAGGEEAGAQGAAGRVLSHDMQRGGFPRLDLTMGYWSEPPRDVLECILDKLKGHRDVLLFSSVCMAWWSFISENLQRFPRQLPLARCLPQQCQLPLLMLPCKDATKSCDFFCAFEQKFYGGAPLPHSNKWIWGSSEGWLVTADISGFEIYLFNPISRAQIYLPPKTEIPQPKCDTHRFGFQTFDYLFKAALSRSPASNIEECSVMAIISAPRVLSLCRPCDSKWTNVADSPLAVDDIIYYKGQFYAVTNFGVVVACDIGPNPKATAVVGRPDVHDNEHLKNRYLVESRGELLQVVRMALSYTDDETDITSRRTVDFKVFKLEEKGLEDDEDDDDDEYESIDEKLVPVEDSIYKWVKLDNLCDQIIFLGYNQSLSLPPDGVMSNSRGNCIYFTEDDQDIQYGRLIEDYRASADDIGVFNMEDSSVHPFHPNGVAFPMPPIWISPTPW